MRCDRYGWPIAWNWSAEVRSVKVFHCDVCGHLVFFENVACVRCGNTLGFLPDHGDLSALTAAEDGTWRALAPSADGHRYRLCRNARVAPYCNWMVNAEDPNPFCVSCRLTEVIPDLAVWGNPERWRKLESAKRRVLYTLRRLGLSTEGVPAENRPPLRFRFLGRPDFGPSPLTGHQRGEITVNIAEADDEERERLRIHLHEPYRTLLGHLRHEVAHYYWDQLISWTPWLTRFRQLFGNEERDYDTALWQFYTFGPRHDWQQRHLSAYASAHPWEDWAETWAHYLHILDTMETAVGFGIGLHPEHPDAKVMTADLMDAADLDAPFGLLLKQWLPLTCALNALNRGMGLPDLYPFMIGEPALEKLHFVHEVVRASRSRARSVRTGTARLN